MKTKSFIYLLMVISAVWLSSCQKELSIENTSSFNEIPDSNYLDKIYKIDPVLNDTTDFISYKYDANKRVIELKDSFGFFNGIEQYYRYKYYYNGTDAYPYKYDFILQEDPGIPNVINTTWFFYDQFNRLIKDSTVGDFFLDPVGDGPVTKYTYGPNRIYCFKTDTTLGVPPTTIIRNVTDTAILQNGNLIENTYRDNFGYLVHSVLTYDNHPSPFYKLSNSKTISMFPLGQTAIDELPQPNNILKIKEVSTGISDNIHDYTNSYTYNAAGYPKSIITSTEKIVFIYRVL